MNDNQLMPCPFCGNSDFLEIEDMYRASVVDTENRALPLYYVICKNVEKCGTVEGPIRFDKQEAIKAWNTRKP